MGHLEGLDEYLARNYEVSVFDTAMTSGKPWALHLHGRRVLRGVVMENRKWEISLDIPGKGKEELQKIQVNYLYPDAASAAVKPLIKVDKKVESMNLEPILAPRRRYFVKNKSLFPLMKEKEVLLFTLLDGEVLRGIVSDFSRYDVTLSMKGGVLVTLLRHSIYDLRNKKGRCFLKSFQDSHRDWEKSSLYIS
jgi:sRNA-binding regulator protein Hfq